MNTSQIRDEARAKAKKPFVTPESVDRLIDKVEYWKVPGVPTTVCCIVLKNGFTVVDHAACVDPENFDEEIQKRLSFSKARDKIFPLLAFCMLQGGADGSSS